MSLIDSIKKLFGAKKEEENNTAEAGATEAMETSEVQEAEATEPVEDSNTAE
jgi:hypothetical protein